MANDTYPTFFDTAYAHAADELYAAIRRDAFGDEIGQNSWLTASEHRSFGFALFLPNLVGIHGNGCSRTERSPEA